MYSACVKNPKVECLITSLWDLINCYVLKGVLVRPILVSLCAMFLSACGESYNYNEPHEYIRTHAYGSQYSELDGNDHQYSGVGVLTKANWFAPHSGKCSKFLHRIKPKDVNISIQAFNNFIRNEGDYNDELVRHVRFECVRFLGEDKDCREMVNVATKNYIEKFQLSGSDMASAIFQAEIYISEKCRDRRDVSTVGVFPPFWL